ncbi:hypothetical protein ACRE1S_07130 [Helicobacter himalayensis]|uniref:hypothetical protein n=1 Tax=Helicobacter himalayensis TaxID=1591088 RepID=UPI003D6F90E8
MKNVVVVNRQCQNIDSFFEKGYRIIVLVVESQQDIETFRAKYDETKILHIIWRFGFEKLEGITHLDFEIIDEFRDAQRKIDFSYHRETLDNMILSNHYFNALFWWNHIFDMHKIDFVFVNGVEHKQLCELCMEVAQRRDIPVFTSPPRLFFSPSLFCFNTNTYLRFVRGHISDEELEQNFYFKFDLEWIPPFYLAHSKVTNAFIKLLFKLGGPLLVDFASYVFKRIRFKKGGRFWAHFYYFLRLKKMKCYYKKISHKPNLKQKYIFYAIHFEPEGNTNVCVPLQNQLTIIQMLSKALPKGCKLIIKEHPLQFMLNQPRMFYYLYGFTYFKDISFYKELQKLPNVEFASLETPSKELINNALAVATINGTVHFESTFANRPCIVFGGQNIMLQGAKNIIYVKNFKKLKEDLARLDSNPHEFDNSAQIDDLREFIKQRAIWDKSPHKICNIIESIEHYILTDFRNDLCRQKDLSLHLIQRLKA